MIAADGLVARIRSHGFALALGVLIGVVGHIAWQRVTDIDLGPDPMAYVETIDEIHPIGASPDAMTERLDRLTDQTWNLENFYAGIDRGPTSLSANAADLADFLSLPPADTFRVRGVLTNVRDPDSTAALGTFAIYRFAGLDQARAWLRTDPQVFGDAADDAGRETYWSGDMAIYYSPPESGPDLSADIRLWAQEVSDCPTTASECEASDSDKG